MGATATVKAAGEGEKRWFYGGGVHIWKVTEEESGGAFMLIEDEMTQGKTTPWHSHPDHDELIYVIDGEIDVNIAGHKQRVSTGGMWMTPRDTPHALFVVSPVARVLAFQTPGSAQAFYYGASEPAGETDGPVDFERIGEVAASTGVTKILGPPPFRRS
jgi:quercetin dioxygenase-like cupin family protein